MEKIREFDIKYLAERVDKAHDLLVDVCSEYIVNGDIEEVDYALMEAYAIITLVNERLEKLSK